MANSEAGTSNNPVQALRGKYQVFLSFRGSDTRYNFTDFLYHNLINAGVRVFKDEDELQEGEVIGDNLLDAINNSVLYIPIFSKNYASSKWCLRELALIVDNVSKSEGKKSILPIFFVVDPEDVKLKTSLYSDAFLEHDKKSPEEVKDWRKALEEVDHIKGWNVKMNQSQVEIVESVVEKVVKELEIKQKSVTENLVGLDDKVKDLIELLDVNKHDVRLIAIYGMGGIGKTTIAKVVFNRLSFHFGKFCSFIEDIRESSSTKEGIVNLQKKLLSDIAGSRIAEQVTDRDQGIRRIGEALCTKKILVVLDDVIEEQQIKNLIITYSLCSGSRIIITTRDKTIPLDAGFNGEIRRYEMLKMDDALALQLFYRHAFAKDFPLDDYHGLSSEIVSIMGGLPLAIEVVGSFLKGKNEAFWKETLAKLKEAPKEEILKKLRISYDDLDKHQKQIFLDIACFFFNKKKTNAIYMWADCSLYPEIGIDVLTSRCLIKILDDDKFWMHDQLIDLGRQIVREESKGDLGKQSRLWIAKDALQLIGTEEIKHKVQALEISACGSPIEIKSEDFKRLPNLRFLDLKGGTYDGDFAKCHPQLRWFSWSNPYFRKDDRNNKFDLDFRASNLYLDELVVCGLYSIDFKDDSKAWDLIKKARNLKVLYITSCGGITSIPDISRCLALERLTLHDCSELKGIESFIGDLRLLIELKIERCSKFTYLSKEVGKLVKLKCFSLKSCTGLRELPGSLGNLISLTELDLSGTKIPELPNSIVQLKSLRILLFPLGSNQYFHYSSHDWQLPSGFGTLVNLEVLNLSRRNRMKGEIPVGIGKCSSLKILNLESTRICGIPNTINELHQLQTLNLTYCGEIQKLPELPTSLTCLLLQSKSLLSVPNLSKLTNLVKLLLSDSSYHIGKSNLISGCDLRWIENLSRLEWLELHLQNVSAPQELASLSHLEELVLTRLDLKPLVQLPSSDWSWRNLRTLKIKSCEEYIPLEGFPGLEKFTVYSVQLEKLSIPSELRKLQEVMVSGCPKLAEIQVVGLSKSLKILEVSYCKSLTRISGLQYLKNLEDLRFEGCTVLANVEGLNELDSLVSLIAYSCSSLGRLIDTSCTKIPDNCLVNITASVYPIEDIRWTGMKRYREILSKISFTIIFHLGAKKSSERFELVGGIKREKAGVDYYSVPYEGLVADVKNFGFCLKRMWYRYPYELVKIKSDRDVNKMLKDASEQGFLVHLSVEGGVDSEWEGEYDEEMMEMLREEQKMKTDVYSDEDKAKWWGCFSSDSDSDSAPMGGESETHGTSSVDLVTPQNSLTIRFHLGVKCFTDFNWGCTGGTEREKEGVDPDSVTYEGLIADVKNFGFCMKRMQHVVPHRMRMEIRCDWDVKYMLGHLTRKKSLIHLLVEGEVDSEWEGEYDDEMMKMLRKQRRMKTDACSDEDGARGGASCPNEDSNFASVGGESKTHGSSSVDDFELERGNAECFEAMTLIVEKNSDIVKKQVELHEEPRDEETLASKHYGEEVFLNTLNKTQDEAEFDISGSDEVPDFASVGESETDGNSSSVDFRSEPGNTECFQATGNRRQMRDGRIGRYDSVEGGKTASIKNRKKDKDVKRDKNVETDRVPTKTGRGSGTGCASNPGRDPTERERQRGRTSRNGEGLSSSRDPASTLGRYMASNSGRDMASSSQSSTTSSLRRDRGSTSGRNTTLTLGRGMTLSSGTSRGSSSRTDKTKIGIASSPKKGITSSLRSSANLSIGRGRGSTLGEGASVSSGRGMTLSSGTGKGSISGTDTTKIGTASSPGSGITSSSQSRTSMSTGRGRGSTSGPMASSGRGKTLSSGRGANKMGTTKMGTSLRSGTNKGASSTKAEPQTSRSLEEQ